MEPVNMKKCCPSDQCAKAFVDLINACEKHKNAALAVKEIAENQKKKLREYRELNSKLYSENYELEYDIKEKDDFIERLKKKRNDLENKVKHLLEKVEVKNEDLMRVDFMLQKQKEVSIDVIKTLEEHNEGLKTELNVEKMKVEALVIEMKQKEDLPDPKKFSDEFMAEKGKLEDLVGDLKSQIALENTKVSTLENEIRKKESKLDDLQDELDIKTSVIEQFALKKTENLKSSSSSLADELKNADINIEKKNLENEVEVLKDEILKIKLFEKKRIAQYQKLEELSEQNFKKLEHLATSLKQLKPKVKPRCLFGWKCSRGSFCEFSHSYLHRKVNSHSPILKPNTPPEQLCHLCGKVFEDRKMFMHHSECCIVKDMTSEIKVPNECQKCFKVFASTLKFRKHIKREHSNFECLQCGKYFVSEDELKKHVCGIHVTGDESKENENKDTIPVVSKDKENPENVRKRSKLRSQLKKTKKEENFRDKYFSAEQHADLAIENTTDEEDIDKAISSDDSSDTNDSETETSEAESGEMYSDS